MENPIVVIDSKKNSDARIVMGDVYDKNGKIITAVLLLTPTSKKGNQLDIIKISSAQGRGHIESLFRTEDGKDVAIRYVDEKRIQNWLNVNRLQLPLRSSNMDSSIDSISQKSEIVKHKAKQPEIIKNSNPAPDSYHTWIRSTEDVKTFEETLADEDWSDGSDFDPDYT